VRPVNLIPPDERRDKAPIRTGPVAYLLVGALALALGAVILLVLTNNKISDRKAEIADLQQQEAAAAAQATQLAPFASFKSVEESRKATITSLADSRFDWDRVMNELARVIPSDVWLTELSGTSATGGAVGTASSSGGAVSADSLGVPALQLTGCAASQNAVAGFLSALRDIDGVTRVGLSSSERPAGETAASSTTDSAAAGNTDCRTREFIPKFEIVAAFDQAPPPQVPQAAPTTPAPAAPATTAPPTTESTPASDTAP
jgi:Tfp pilus assembly protein PilN